MRKWPAAASAGTGAWPQSARARLRELRIFPRKVEHRTPSEWLEAKRLGCDVFSCLITTAAHRKLRDADLVAIRTLLD